MEQEEQEELHIHKVQGLIMDLVGGAGGGGSGFVCTATSRPSSGYYVDSKYNLSNATTYAGSSSFTSTSGGTETGHSGNGYAKITLVSGTATVTVGNETRYVRPNESTYIKMGELHRLENEGKIPVVLIEAQVGEYTGEDDIVRIDDDFKRA